MFRARHGAAVLLLVASLAPFSAASAAPPPPIAPDPLFGGTGVVDLPGGVMPRGLTLLTSTPSGGVLAQEGHGEALHVVARTLAGGVDSSYWGDGVCAPAVWGRPLLLLSDGSLIASTGPSSAPDGLMKFDSNCGRVEEFGAGGVAPAGRVVQMHALSDGRLLAIEVGLSGGFSLTMLTPTGAVDESFGVDGRLTPEAGTTSVAVDGSSIVLTLRSDPQPRVQRLTATGAPDGSFGDGGISTLSVSDEDLVNVAVRVEALTNGGYAVVLAHGPPFGAMTYDVARLHHDGSEDLAYGGDGRSPAGPPGSYAYLTAARPGGGVDIAGSVQAQPRGIDGFVVRLDAEGERVVAFGEGGVATVDVDAAEDPIAISSDGAGGAWLGINGGFLAHVDSSGELSGGEGGGGLLRGAPFLADAAVGELVQDPQGRMIVVGANGLVARLRPDGRPDPTFGGGGSVQPRVRIAALERWEEVALDPTGAIVVGGEAHGDDARPILARLTPNGSLDATFGSGGRVQLPDLASVAGVVAAVEPVAGLIVLPDRRVLVAGTVADDAGVMRGYLARLDLAGKLDATFGEAGVHLFEAGTGFAVADLVSTPAGPLLVGGRRVPGGVHRDQEVVLVPLVADGTPSGQIRTGLGGSTPFLAVAEPGGGATVLLGGHGIASPQFRDRLVRFRRDGTVDSALGGSDGAAVDHLFVDAVGRMADGGMAFHVEDHVGRVRPDGDDDPVWRDLDVPTHDFLQHAAGASIVMRPDGLVLAFGAPRALGQPATLRIIRYVFVPGWRHTPAMHLSPWQPLGGAIRDNPALASTGYQQRDVFARGTDDQIWYRRDGAAASAWQPLGGRTVDGPSASGIENLAVVAVRGLDGAVWLKSRNGDVWSPWTSIGGQARGSPAVLVSEPPVGVTVAVRGTDDQLWYREYGFQGWGPWTALGGRLTSAPAVTTSGPGGMVVAARGGDGALWARTKTATWARVGGAIVGAPAIVQRGYDTYDAFVRGTDNQLWTALFVHGAPGAFQPLGRVLSSSPEVEPTNVSSMVRTIGIVARGADGQVWEATTIPYPH